MHQAPARPPGIIEGTSMAAKRSANSLFANLKRELDKLDEAGREEFRRLVLDDPFFGNETAWAVLSAGMTVHSLRAKNSRRSRPEDKARNDLIRAEHKAGLTAGQISKKHGWTKDTVKGVLNRMKTNYPPMASIFGPPEMPED
jgi:lambda repressor-like predicted transcriptional regulator